MSKSEKVKILHVMDKLSVDGSQIHGPARQISYRVPCYDPSRYEVMLCNLRNEDAAARALVSKGVKVVSLSRGKFNLLAGLDICKIIRKWNPSVLHLHGYAAWNFGRVAGKFMGVPVVVQEHFVDEKIPSYQKFLDWCLGSMQQRAMAVSEAVKEFMLKDRYVRGTTVSVIWNGVPLDTFNQNSKADASALAEELDIDADAKVIGIVGRLADMKGHKYFLRAGKQIVKEIPNGVLVVVGEGPLRNDLRSQAKELGIEEKVKFVGYQANVSKYLSLFDVSVIASIYGEGFPGVGIETFAAGTPLVVTNLPTYVGFYEHNKNSIIVKAHDSDALAEAICFIIKNPEVAMDLVRNGKETLKECNIQSIAARYTQCYEELLKECT